jgi:hypothetical protein
MFKTSAQRKYGPLTVGEQIVNEAHTGVSGFGEFTLDPADCQYVLDNCDFTQPVNNPNDQKTNRPIQDRRKNKYVHSMSDVGVIDTGATLKFDTNGNLFDGKHRLTAAIEVGVVFKTLIAFGRSTKAFAVIDGAISGRTKTELFTMAKIKRGALLSSVTELLMHWRGDAFIQISQPSTGEELVNLYLTTVDDDLMQDCALRCDHAYKTIRYPMVSLCALLYILRVYGDEAKANEFVNCIASGNWDGKNASLRVLFAYFRQLKSTPGMIMRPAFKLAMLIHTWNTFCTGRKGTTKKLSRVQYNVKLNLKNQGK